MGEFEDVAAERAVHAGILQYGFDAFIDCDGLLNPSSFSVESNQCLWKVAEEHYRNGDAGLLDVATVRSISRRLGFGDLLDDPDERRHLVALSRYHVELATVRREAGKLFKLGVARDLLLEMRDAAERLKEIDGSEPLDEILSRVENPIFDFTTKLSGQGEGPIHIADGGEEWLENSIAHPTDNIGIPSPFPIYNALIGGGFRRGTVSVVGARMKNFKTVLADNICLHVAGKLSIPVFNVDTEMTQKQHLARILAHLTQIDSNRIERGHVSAEEATRLREAMQYLKSIPYHYQCVIGQPFSEQIASMRRWVIKRVGMDPEGRRKDALIIYDYLQVADISEFVSGFGEHQMLGFYMNSLLSLAEKCDIPFFTLVQLSRKGIEEDTTAAVGDSDKIGRKCANLSLLRKKTDKDTDFDEGQVKLINLFARHGPGGLPGDYINIKCDGATSRMEEGRTRYELERIREKERKGFEHEVPQDAKFTLSDQPIPEPPRAQRDRQTRVRAGR